VGARSLIEHEEVRIALTLLADILAETRKIRQLLAEARKIRQLLEEDDGEEEEAEA
jgi:hypothetical protein